MLITHIDITVYFFQLNQKAVSHNQKPSYTDFQNGKLCKLELLPTYYFSYLTLHIKLWEIFSAIYILREINCREFIVSKSAIFEKVEGSDLNG